MTKTHTDKTDAINTLRTWLTPGDTVYTILRHVSRSGMQRRISCVIGHVDTDALISDGALSEIGTNRAIEQVRRSSIKAGVSTIDYWVSRATGIRQHPDGGLIMGGCGMDTGFALVYKLSQALYGAGYACLGEGKRCPSNYHANHRRAVSCPDDCTRQEVDWIEASLAIRALPQWNRTIETENGPQTVRRAAMRLHVRETVADDGTDTLELCPTCGGRGELPNPDGPERFDLTHTDGYALHGSWL